MIAGQYNKRPDERLFGLMPLHHAANPYLPP